MELCSSLSSGAISQPGLPWPTKTRPLTRMGGEEKGAHGWGSMEQAGASVLYEDEKRRGFRGGSRPVCIRGCWLDERKAVTRAALIKS